jgi:hypothetical protein
MRIINRSQDTINIPPMTNIGQLERAEPQNTSAEFIQQIAQITVGPTEYLSPEADVTDCLPGRKEPSVCSKFQYVIEKVDWDKIQLTNENRAELKRIIAGHLEAFVGPDKMPGDFRGPIKQKLTSLNQR